MTQTGILYALVFSATLTADRLRSTFDSFISTGLRIVLIGLLPLVTYGVERIPWMIIPFLYTASILAAMPVFLRKNTQTRPTI